MGVRLILMEYEAVDRPGQRISRGELLMCRQVRWAESAGGCRISVLAGHAAPGLGDDDRATGSHCEDEGLSVRFGKERPDQVFADLSHFVPRQERKRLDRKPSRQRGILKAKRVAQDLSMIDRPDGGMRLYTDGVGVDLHKFARKPRTSVPG